MSRQMKGKIKSSKLTFENEKENTSGSDLQSLLVSSIRYDNQSLPIAQSQGPQNKSKPSLVQQSLIKKQYVSNVYIEEGCDSKCQYCQKKIDAIHENLTLINLRLQQFQSKLNICFGKYGKTQARLGQIEILMEQFKHFEQQNFQKMKELSSRVVKSQQQMNFKVRDWGEQLNRLKKMSMRLQERQSDKSCFESKRVEHKLQKYKDEQQLKIRQIIETIEKVGNLQRKMIEEGSERSEENTLFLYDAPIKKKYFRTYSICEKNTTNQSTNISYSRNYDCPK